MCRPGINKEVFCLLYSRALQARNHFVEVRLVGDDQIICQPQQGEPVTVFTENLWRQCRQTPEVAIETVQRHLAAFEMRTGDKIELAQIVVQVRDQSVVDMLRPGQKGIFEHMVADLWVIYSVDLPASIQTLTPSQLEALSVDRSVLRALALENLLRILPQTNIEGAGPWFYIAAGDYTSSILLFDSVWDQAAEIVEGDVVAAVPTRDTLLITGSDSVEGIAAIRKMAREIHDNGHHVISPTLIRREGTTWKLFE